ncbi:hypothetical protein ANN_20312 [Periplaneta americana]|uniref:Uncharacterized protein n=1 Tax=Periplaneta americana TaxID=6978 RepID=A0ABQ8SCI4_PERAM|nr:hypothetical protein ANN_20312 [Periplaneta americana]
MSADVLRLTNVEVLGLLASFTSVSHAVVTQVLAHMPPGFDPPPGRDEICDEQSMSCRGFFLRLFNDAVSTTRLFSIEEIGDSEMIFGEMRPRIRHRLPGIHITTFEMGEPRNAYRVLVGRPEGKIHLGRPRRRWEDNIKMDLREVGCDDGEWINLAQAGLCEGGSEPSGSLKASKLRERNENEYSNAILDATSHEGLGPTTRLLSSRSQASGKLNDPPIKTEVSCG